jgi:hypothetical protein
MQITALIQVINYLKTLSGDPSLLEGYKRLSEIVREASKNPERDFQSGILKEKAQLSQFLRENDPVNWGYASYSLFEKFNANKLFGKSSADYLETLITADNKDYQAIYTELSKKIKLISKFSDTLNKFQQLFDQVVPAEVFQSAENTGNKTSLLLYFEGHVSVQNISDLERYARLWDGILNTFSMISGEPSLPLDVSNFSAGNFVMGVTSSDRTYNTIMTGVEGIVSSLPLILRIRKVQLEIASLPLHNDFNELLEEEIKTLITDTALTTAQKLTSYFSSDNTDPDEMVNDISRALKQILSFIEKGGKIEFETQTAIPEVTRINKLLTETFSITRELEKLIDALTQALSKKNDQQNLSEQDAVILSVF